MFKNTRKTIFKILTLYLGTSAVFLCIGFYFLNVKMTKNIIHSQMAEMRDIAFDILEILRRNYIWENAIDEITQKTPIPFAIYDGRNRELFSNLSKNPTPRELKAGFYHFKDKVIANPLLIPHREFERPHRKARYQIFLESDNLNREIMLMRVRLGGALFAVFVAIGVVATILVRLFLKPLNEYISALDLFIKDTTHEINTPLSVILMSIETLKTSTLPPSDMKKIERIKFASLQLNTLYSALVAFSFPNHNRAQNHSQNLAPKEQLDLKAILENRLEFFAPLFSQKNIELRLNLAESSLLCEKNAIVTIFDNLLSNAVKYNKKGGFIALVLKNGVFSIENSGAKIKDEHKDSIFERYTRFGDDTGGFGIGLSLVKKLCDENGIEITLENAESSTDIAESSTKFILKWR